MRSPEEEEARCGELGPQLPMGPPHLTVQAHLHCADLSSMLINAEELRAALLQDGEPEGCIVCLWIIGICGLSPCYEGAWGRWENVVNPWGQVWWGTQLVWSAPSAHRLPRSDTKHRMVACFCYCLCHWG